MEAVASVVVLAIVADMTGLNNAAPPAFGLEQPTPPRQIQIHKENARKSRKLR